jgi:purine-cytosine permease-like protein
LTAATFKPPRSLLTTKVASASPSMSSAMISSGRDDCTTASKIGNIGCRLVSLVSWIKMKGFSISQVILSALVTKYGEV